MDTTETDHSFSGNNSHITVVACNFDTFCIGFQNVFDSPPMKSSSLFSCVQPFLKTWSKWTHSIINLAFINILAHDLAYVNLFIDLAFVNVLAC